MTPRIRRPIDLGHVGSFEVWAGRLGETLVRCPQETCRWKVCLRIAATRLDAIVAACERHAADAHPGTGVGVTP